jgi:hypothetical protein
VPDGAGRLCLDCLQARLGLLAGQGRLRGDAVRDPVAIDGLDGRTQAPAYVAFDILWADGTDLRTLPLSERRQRLDSVLLEANRGTTAAHQPLRITADAQPRALVRHELVAR